MAPMDVSDYGLEGYGPTDACTVRKGVYRVMKRVKIGIIIAGVLILLGAGLPWGSDRWRELREMEEKTGLDLPRHEAYGYVDTHGGFFGDGDTVVTLTFSKEADEKLREQMENLPYWNSMPLSNNLHAFLYGGYVEGMESFQTMWLPQTEWPEITQGYWYLLDESSEVTGDGDETGEAHNDANLFKRASFNVTVVVYDTETRTVYYYELDT